MKLYETLIDLLEDVKSHDREIRFIDGENDESVIGFGELWERARALLGALQPGYTLWHGISEMLERYQEWALQRYRGVKLIGLQRQLSRFRPSR